MLHDIIARIKKLDRVYYIIFALAVVVAVVALILGIANNDHTPRVKMEKVATIPEIDTSEMESCYSVPILSTSRSSAISSTVVKLNNYKDYLDYVDDHQDITVTYPIRDDSATIPTMYQNGYIGIVVTSDEADPNKLLYASYSHLDKESNRLYVALTTEPIPENWVLSKDLSKSKQSSTIAFISKAEAENIHSMAAYLLPEATG